MAAIEFNWKPDNRQLRQFGVAALIALPLASWLFSGRPGPATWAPHNTWIIGGAALVGLLLAAIGWVRPQAIRYVFILACLAAFPIGLVIGETILLIIFALLFVPIALVFRLMGRDALDRSIDRNRTTYWQAKQTAPNIESYFRQS